MADRTIPTTEHAQLAEALMEATVQYLHKIGMDTGLQTKKRRKGKNTPLKKKRVKGKKTHRRKK
jgi:hypothetical protein